MPYWIATPCDTVRTSHLKSDQWLSLAILSRWQFADANYSLLPNPQLSLPTATGITLLSHDKGFLKIKQTFANQTFAVLTGHALPFGLFGRDVMEETFDPIRRAMEQVILASPEQPTIVTGDFNYTSIEHVLPNVLNAGYTRALVGVATEPSRGQQLDHILFSPHWQLLQSAVIPTRADHYFCYADLALEG